jgi:hypothetical protein
MLTNMPDYSPFRGKYRRTGDVQMSLARSLWTLRSAVGKEVTAAIYEVPTGRELRISLGEELLESCLSRMGGDTALECRAAELCAILKEKGWMETCASEGSMAT